MRYLLEFFIIFQFFGYDLGTNRVQFSGKSTEFFSNDGTSSRVDITEFLYQETLLTIKITKFHNHLYFHSFVDIKGKGYVGDDLMFHVIFRNEILVVFTAIEPGKLSRAAVPANIKIRGLTAQRSLMGISTISEQLKKLNANANQGTEKPSDVGETKQSTHENIFITDEFGDEKILFDMKVTWPSGMVLETMRNPFFYLKQHYITKGKLVPLICA